MRRIIPLLVLLVCLHANAQQYNYYINGFLQMPNAPAARQYLGISNNTSGSGGVTNFAIGNFSPLFTASATTPTTFPHVTFNPVGQNQNLVYASPDGSIGFPSFRLLAESDIPSLTLSKISDAGTVAAVNGDGNPNHFLNGTLGWTVPAGSGGGGTVSNFTAGNASPLFTTSVGDPTGQPALTFNLLYVPLTNTATAITQALGSTFVQNANFATIAGSLQGGVIQNVTNAGLGSDVSMIAFSNQPIVGIKALATGSGVSFTDRGTDVVINATSGGTVSSFSSGDLSPLFTTSVATPTTTPALSFILTSQSANTVFAGPSSGGAVAPTFRGLVAGDISGVLTSVTNASLGLVGVTMIGTSNPPIASIKSISAGGNVSVTDQGGTNIQIAATPGGAFLTDLLQAETNATWTVRPVASDAADGAAAGFTGFGDSISYGSSISGAALLRHSTAAPIIGTWSEMSVGAAANAAEFAASQTFEAMPPYPSSTFTCQASLQIRNTNTCRTLMGFSAAAITTTLTTDALKTNCVFFRFSPASNDLTWHGVVSDGTNQTVVDTGVQLTNDGLYFLSFVKTTTNTVVFTVNRSSSVTATSSVPVSYRGPQDGMAFFCGMANLNNSTGAKTNLLRYVGYKSEWLSP